MNVKKVFKNKNNLIIGLVVVVLFMAVSFAAFSQRLTITENSSITSNWNVGFSGAEADVTCTGTPTSKCGTVLTSIDTTNGTTKTLNFNTKLFKPGDVVTYSVSVANYGNVNVLLKDVVLTPTTTTNNIKYAHNMKTSVLAPGQGKTFYVTVTFEQVDGTVAAQTNGVTLYIDCEQEKGTAGAPEK